MSHPTATQLTVTNPDMPLEDAIAAQASVVPQQNLVQMQPASQLTHSSRTQPYQGVASKSERMILDIREKMV